MNLLSKNKLYEFIAHSSTDYLSIANEEYTYLAVNEAYAKGFNRNVDQIEGRKIEELLGKEGFENTVKPNFDRCLRENDVVRYEDWFDLTEGRRFFSVSYNPILLENGQRVVVVNAHDNTGRKLLEESLEKAVDDLQKANSFKDRLFSLVSHDVKAPINAINNFLQLLGNDDLDFDGVKALVPAMSSRLHTTREMLDNLLGWASAQLKGENLAFEDFSLKEIIDENIALFESEISKKQLSIKNEIPEDLLIKGDINAIRMVIRNLFSNSIKFSFEQGVIKVMAKEKLTDSLQSFTFCDEGKGMTEEKANRLFKGMVSSEKGTQGETGTGLGMMLTADSILMHGGSIRAESKEGQGTTYHFTLPIT